MLISIVVFDEVHFFCSDSPFNSETSSILQQLIKAFPDCKRICMSATPDEVKDIIALEEARGYINRYILANQLVSWSPIINSYDDPTQHYLYNNYYGGYNPTETFLQRAERLRQAPLPNIKHYVFVENYEHINLHFFYDWERSG